MKHKCQLKFAGTTSVSIGVIVGSAVGSVFFILAVSAIWMRRRLCFASTSEVTASTLSQSLNSISQF